MTPRWRRGGRARTVAPFDLGTPVCWLSPKDALTLGQCCEGVLVTGTTGSGKTSGPGDSILLGLLSIGCGALVLCAKPGECERVLKLARAVGREADVVRFAPGERWTWDVIGQEITAVGGGVESAAQLLDTLLRLSQKTSGKGNSEPFWEGFASRIIRMALTVALAATGSASVADVDEIVSTAPKTQEACDSEDLDKESLCARLIYHASKLDLTPAERRDMKQATDFFLEEWPRLSDKTRSVGEAFVRNVTSKFVTGYLHDLVASGSSNLPSVMDGAIVVADMPVLQFRELGQFFGCLLKQSISRQVLRRPVTDDMRPVVIVADEAQLYADPDSDAMTQTVARQSRLISLALTQSLPTLYSAAGGGDSAKQAMDSWMANHQTKIICANGCAETNSFHEKLLGTERKAMYSGSAHMEEYDPFSDLMGRPQGKSTGSWSQQIQPAIPAHEFTKLEKGGPVFNYKVGAYVFQAGRIFSNGKTHMRVTFPQRRK